MSDSSNVGINIAVVGATGMVGTATLKILHERKFPIQNIYAVASKKSAGAKVFFGEDGVLVEDLNFFDFSKVNIALFCTEASVSQKFISKATERGCVVIDKSSHFRMDNDVPLIVPEVNLSDINNIKKNIIANPNCVAIPLAVALAPLHKKFTIKRVVIATYQSVSGAGKAAIEELWSQTKNMINQEALVARKFSKQIAFNLISHIDVFEEDGFTKEETKIRNEIKKIIDSKIEIVATCVRVPVFVSHSIAANIEFGGPVSVQEATAVLKNTAGVVASNNILSSESLSPVDTAGKDFVYVSRIRKDPSKENALCIWIAADNIRKGAALNAVQIAEHLHFKLHVGRARNMVSNSA